MCPGLALQNSGIGASARIRRRPRSVRFLSQLRHRLRHRCCVVLATGSPSINTGKNRQNTKESSCCVGAGPGPHSCPSSFAPRLCSGTIGLHFLKTNSLQFCILNTKCRWEVCYAILFLLIFQMSHNNLFSRIFQSKF